MKKLFTLVLILAGGQIFGQPPGWFYNQPITVTNPNSQNAVDYQLKIIVNTQALIAASKMTPTGSDLRFGGTCTGNTFYNYWIEGGINTTTTAIWVKIPLIAANTSSTIFMFYGNTAALPASTIPGTFRGPNSSTDSVTTSTTPGGMLVCQRGFRFSPNQNILVTDFGKNEPTGSTRFVTLFNYGTQAILSQTQVAGPCCTYTYAAMQNPLWLTASTQYVIQIYGLATDGYYFAPSSQIGLGLTYYEQQATNGGTQNTFPSLTVANYHYGYVDFLYYLTNTLAITPTYTLGGSLINITGASSPICSGNSVTLTTNATGTYSWNTGSSTSSIVVAPTSNTSYSVAQFNMTGCNSTALITVTVNQGLPTLTVTNTALAGGICPTKSVNLTASGAITYTWIGGSPTVTNGVTFFPTAAYDYTVRGENACGTSSAVTSVSVHPFPTVNPSASSSTLCAGGGLTLTATGNATNYAWSGGNAPSGNGVGFFPPASTITYSVIGTSALTCTAQATIPVTVHATPNAAPAANPILICLGNSSTLTATGAASYTWASSTNTVFTSTFVVTPATHGVSTYTVTKANSTCSDTKLISITTNSLPGIFAMVTPTVVCALQPASLTIGGGTSYTWTAPGTPNFSFTGASPIVYPQAPVEYTVAASDGTCVSVTTVSLAVDPNPTITISASAPSLCVGGAVTMTAQGGSSYTWTSSASTNTLFTQVINESPTVATSYNVIGNNSFGCTASANQVVIVHNTPPLTVTSSKNLVCSGGPSTLTAGGANTYTWDASAGGVLTPTALVNPVALSSGPVEYTVSGSFTSTGCKSTKTVQVNVYVPVLTITGNTNSCAGGQISLAASGGNPNTYTWSTGTSITNFQNITTSLTAPAIFTVSATGTSVSINSAICPATQTVALGIHFNPTITAVPDRTTIICKGESVELRADGGISYTWNNSQTGPTITVNPPFQTNNYVVTGTDVNGCSNSATVQVKVSNCNGIDELSGAAGSIQIYPNPNNGEFTIKAASEMSLTLINELGQVIRTIKLSGANKYSVSVTDLAKGIYFIEAPGIQQKVIVTK